jgi:hypothetical protein
MYLIGPQVLSKTKIEHIYDNDLLPPLRPARLVGSRVQKLNIGE